MRIYLIEHRMKHGCEMTAWAPIFGAQIYYEHEIEAMNQRVEDINLSSRVSHNVRRFEYRIAEYQRTENA